MKDGNGPAVDVKPDALPVSIASKQDQKANQNTKRPKHGGRSLPHAEHTMYI